YGHHPVEIRSVLAAARQACDGRLVAIVQPHRYTRLRDLFDEFAACFNDADTVLVAPVYPAGERPIPGVDSEELVRRMKAAGHRDARAIAGPEAIAPVIRQLGRPGDYTVFLGAGTITQWAHGIVGELADEAAAS